MTDGGNFTEIADAIGDVADQITEATGFNINDVFDPSGGGSIKKTIEGVGKKVTGAMKFYDKMKKYNAAKKEKKMIKEQEVLKVKQGIADEVRKQHLNKLKERREFRKQHEQLL